MSKPDPELSDLLSGLIDDNLSDEQYEKLDQRLATDPEARRFYRQYLSLTNNYMK